MFMDLTPGMKLIILGVLLAIIYGAFQGKNGGKGNSGSGSGGGGSN